jgi:hypothetical protein
MIVGAGNNNNRCDIPSLVEPYSEQLQWGTNPVINNNAIYESYINFLNCPTDNHVACYNSSCIQDIISFACGLSYQGLGSLRDDSHRLVTFYIVGLVDNSSVTHTKIKV